MKTNQKTGRIVGVLLLLIMAVGIPSLSLRGLSTSMGEDLNFLEYIHQNALGMRFGMVLDITASGLWLFISIYLFPKIKAYSSGLALAFFGLWVINLGIIIYSNISHLSLISLSGEFVKPGATNLDILRTLGLLKIEDYFWSHFMALITYAMAAFVFYYFLFRTKLVPKLLGLWGMIAITLVFMASWINIFDLDISFHFYSQNGIFMIVFMGWLIAKGFADPAVQNS